jgi:hypothetical protein
MTHQSLSFTTSASQPSMTLPCAQGGFIQRSVECPSTALGGGLIRPWRTGRENALATGH